MFQQLQLFSHMVGVEEEFFAALLQSILILLQLLCLDHCVASWHICSTGDMMSAGPVLWLWNTSPPCSSALVSRQRTLVHKSNSGVFCCRPVCCSSHKLHPEACKVCSFSDHCTVWPSGDLGCPLSSNVFHSCSFLCLKSLFSELMYFLLGIVFTNICCFRPL